jgi:hypothetical protein
VAANLLGALAHRGPRPIRPSVDGSIQAIFFVRSSGELPVFP